MAHWRTKVTACRNFTTHSPCHVGAKSYQFLTYSGPNLVAPPLAFAPLRGMSTMATARKGFARERHAAMKTVITGIALSGFIGSWFAFASAHPGAVADNVPASPGDSERVLESIATPTSIPSATVASVPPTATSTNTVAPATATPTSRASSPQQVSTQAPIAPTSTPVPPTPVPAVPTATSAVPTATAGAPKPTPTKAPKKTRAS